MLDRTFVAKCPESSLWEAPWGKLQYGKMYFLQDAYSSFPDVPRTYVYNPWGFWSGKHSDKTV